MAFPASPSNNDVHKEGNRSFVWDSTLGTWDQVKEIDRIFVPTSSSSSVPLDQITLSPTVTGSAPYGTEGALYYDSDKDALMVSNGISWNGVGVTGRATGGTPTAYQGDHYWQVHSFTSTGSDTFTVEGGSLICDVLLVAGGGGVAAAEGAAGSTGGGGGGGLVEIVGLTVEPGAYTLSVGAGGAGSGNWTVPASQGGQSTGFGYIAIGGGGGPDYGTAGGIGGSGSGGSEDSEDRGETNQNRYLGDPLATGYGYPGWPGGPYPGGHGGAGGGAGGRATGVGSGANGPGKTNAFRTGSNVTYAAGGDGGRDNVDGTAGGANTGNGANGDSTTSGNNTTNVAGGSGIIVIRY